MSTVPSLRSFFVLPSARSLFGPRRDTAGRKLSSFVFNEVDHLVTSGQRAAERGLGCRRDELARAWQAAAPALGQAARSACQLAVAAGQAVPALVGVAAGAAAARTLLPLARPVGYLMGAVVGEQRLGASVAWLDGWVRYLSGETKADPKA